MSDPKENIIEPSLFLTAWMLKEYQIKEFGDDYSDISLFLYFKLEELVKRGVVDSCCGQEMSSLQIEYSSDKLEEYINKYLELWSQNKLVCEDENIYSSTKQIEATALIMLKLSEDFPSNNLQFIAKIPNGDCFASLVYLRENGYLEIKKCTLQKTVLDFSARVVVDLKPKFFETFSLSKNGTVISKLTNLVDDNKVSIVFDGFRTLVCKGVKYKMNSHSLPLELMKLWKGEGVEIETLREALGIKSTPNIIKSVEAFKAKLKDKFQLKSDVKLIEIYDGKIFLTEIFQ